MNRHRSKTNQEMNDLVRLTVSEVFSSWWQGRHARGMSVKAVGASSQQIRKQKVRRARSRSTSNGLCLPARIYLQKLHFLQNSAITGDNYAKHGPVGAFQIQIITHDALHCGAHSLSQRCPNHGYSVIILYIIRGGGFFLPIPSAGIPQGTVSHTGISVVLGGCITYYACYHQNIQYEATFSEVFILAIWPIMASEAWGTHSQEAESNEH